jgi:hypothetical protein
MQRRVRLELDGSGEPVDAADDDVRNVYDKHDEHHDDHDDFDDYDRQPMRTHGHDHHDDDDHHDFDHDDARSVLLVPLSDILRHHRRRLRDDLLHRQRQQHAACGRVYVDHHDDYDFDDDDVRLQHDHDQHDDHGCRLHGRLHLGKPAEQQRLLVLGATDERLRAVVSVRCAGSDARALPFDDDAVRDCYVHDDNCQAVCRRVYLVLAADQSAVEAVRLRLLDDA